MAKKHFNPELRTWRGRSYRTTRLFIEMKDAAHAKAHRDDVSSENDAVDTISR